MRHVRRHPPCRRRNRSDSGNSGRGDRGGEPGGGGPQGGIATFLGLTGATSLSGGLMIGAGVVGGIAGSVASLGLGVATGIQDKFSWKGVAAAGIGGRVSNALGARVGNGLGAGLVTNTAGGLANATVRSLADGTSFGDNLIAALPEVI